MPAETNPLGLRAWLTLGRVSFRRGSRATRDSDRYHVKPGAPHNAPRRAARFRAGHRHPGRFCIRTKHDIRRNATASVAGLASQKRLQSHRRLAGVACGTNVVDTNLDLERPMRDVRAPHRILLVGAKDRLFSGHTRRPYALGGKRRRVAPTQCMSRPGRAQSPR